MIIAKDSTAESELLYFNGHFEERAADAAALEHAIHNLSSFYGLDMLDWFISDVTDLVVTSIKSGGRSGKRRDAQWKMLLTAVKSKQEEMRRNALSD